MTREEQKADWAHNDLIKRAKARGAFISEEIKTVKAGEFPPEKNTTKARRFVSGTRKFQQELEPGGKQPDETVLSGDLG